MIDGWRADGDTGAALAFVIVKPAPMATAATSESRTLRMEFSLGFIERRDNRVTAREIPKVAVFQTITLRHLNCPWADRSSVVHVRQVVSAVLSPRNHGFRFALI